MLQAKNLTKRYQNQLALDNLNLTIHPGEIFCLLGQNGAGKTTTINLFLGFVEATSGKAYVNNTEVKSNGTDTRQHLAYIPEVVMLYGQLSAMENLDFFSRLAGFRYEKNQLSAFLSTCGLQAEAHDKRLNGFSKGMRQKVGIAIALAKNASAILMDEPTSGLDPKATSEFTELVKSLGAQGKSVLMATHDIFNAVNTATHLGIMKEGRLIESLKNENINANEVEALYLETISLCS